MEEKVWYASYGSNMYYDRFMCYIEGGTPDGSSTGCSGCTSKDPPEQIETIDIDHELYFSKESSSWKNLGVAFIKFKENEQKKTLGVMYLITKMQFIEVVQQENIYYYIDRKPEIDFNAAIQNKYISLKPKWYGRILYLGEKDDHSIFTFTANWNDESFIPNKPSREYLSIIARGLRDNYSMSKSDIVDYLIDKIGISDEFDEDGLSIYLDLPEFTSYDRMTNRPYMKTLSK